MQEVPRGPCSWDKPRESRLPGQELCLGSELVPPALACSSYRTNVGSLGRLGRGAQGQGSFAVLASRRLAFVPHAHLVTLAVCSEPAGGWPGRPGETCPPGSHLSRLKPLSCPARSYLGKRRGGAAGSVAWQFEDSPALVEEWSPVATVSPSQDRGHPRCLQQGSPEVPPSAGVSCPPP